jgi:non-ribosomal peptide synthetase component F
VAVERPFGDALSALRDTVLDAYAHQDLPFELLVEELQPERSLNRTPFFQVAFALQNVPPPRAVALPGVTVSPIPVAGRTAKFDLPLFVHDRPRLGGYLEFNSDLFDPTTLDRFLVHFERLLEGIVEAPGTPFGELPLLSAPERHQLRLEWTDTARARRPGVLIQDPFERRAAEAPGAVAVVSAEGETTYGELEERTRRLAWRLRRAGVGPGSTVGVHVRRSGRMVEALLGVVRSGGAYVPLHA